MFTTRRAPLALIPTVLCLLGALTLAAGDPPGTGSPPSAMFQTADACIGCHTGMVSPTGEDVSFGPQWRASMMANSARDPYWQAGVRREILEHPQARAHIEDECSVCHMPMARTQSRAAGHEGEIFAHLPIGAAGTRAAELAADGVSCTACHQITAERLGERSSLTGGYHVDVTRPYGQRLIYGPYDVDRGRTRIMRSSSATCPPGRATSPRRRCAPPATRSSRRPSAPTARSSASCPSRCPTRNGRTAHTARPTAASRATCPRSPATWRSRPCGASRAPACPVMPFAAATPS